MRIAAAQTHSAWLDRTAGADVVIDWIGRAAADGVDLLAFGETFVPGYPVWADITDAASFNVPHQKRAFSMYLDQAVELPGPDMARMAEAARDGGVFTYVGIAERGTGTARGTVYATLVAIDPVSGIVSAHRKLMPTFGERLVWGIGDGHGLRVHERPDGTRVGGLNCWENWMPLARQAMYAGGEDLHVAVWPGAARLTESITRFIAREGRVFALSAGTLIDLDDIPADFPVRDQIAAWVEANGGSLGYDGGSCIAGPDGAWIVPPVAEEERLVIADIDPAQVREERHNFDPTGHYGRADVLSLRVDRRRPSATVFDDGAETGSGEDDDPQPGRAR